MLYYSEGHWVGQRWGHLASSLFVTITKHTQWLTASSSFWLQNNIWGEEPRLARLWARPGWSETSLSPHYPLLSSVSVLGKSLIKINVAISLWSIQHWTRDREQRTYLKYHILIQNNVSGGQFRRPADWVSILSV